MRKKIENLFMEVSSHALHQNRVSYIDFDSAIFSNITQRPSRLSQKHEELLLMAKKNYFLFIYKTVARKINMLL